MTHQAALLAEVTRRDERDARLLIESRHLGHVVVTVDDVVVTSVGEPDRLTFVRSAIKPVQAAVCLEVLAAAGWPHGRPGDDEIAVAWSSHRGEPAHLAAVAALCRRAGIEPDQLTCPAAATEDGPDHERARIQHNCSGKHALFALAGRSLGLGRDELLDRDAPLQRAILARLEQELGGLEAVGVDGCGAPTARVPLSGLARCFGRLAVDDDFRAVRDAGLAHPDLVGGTGRLESALLAGGTVAKLGAEGIYAAGWVEDGRRVGVAVKCEDGATRAAAAAMGAIAADRGRPLSGWQPDQALGGGEVVGGVRCPDALLDDLGADWT